MNPEYKMERGTGTLYSRSCSKSNTIGKWLHLVINALSTLLLSGSNYTQQCLAAPTRSEVDAAHARRRWMDIGVPSVRNLFMIKAERRLLWIAIGITSVPLHLLYVYITVSTRVLANREHFRYNSAVYASLMANNIFVTAVTSNHFEPESYSNTTGMFYPYRWTSLNATTGKEYGDIGYRTDSHDIQLFISMLEGYNSSTPNYEDLTPSQCISLYTRGYMSNHRNLFLITNLTSNSMSNDTLLRLSLFDQIQSMENGWMWPPSLWRKRF